MAERSHAELDRAYRRTAFHVDFPEGRLTIRVGRRHPELDRQMPHHSGWSFVTAFNPGSEALAEADNDRRQSALEQVARALGARVIPGWGCGEGDWPPERSCLISGLDDETCCRLGRLFGQHAVVLGETGATPDCGGSVTAALTTSLEEHAVHRFPFFKVPMQCGRHLRDPLI